MRADLALGFLTTFLRRRWRLLAGLCLAGAGIYVAATLSDTQGRADLASGYAVRMTCEDDPESDLWGGGCERIAADIARSGRPSFFALYRAFVAAHHSVIPSPATMRRFAHLGCEPGFDAGKALKGTRFILTPDAFVDACSGAQAHAIMGEIDARDRALLTIERAGLSWQALVAGTLANLTEPLVLLGTAAVVLGLWIL